MIVLITPEYTHCIQLQSNSNKHSNPMLLSQDSSCHGRKEGGRKGLLGADKVHFLNNMVIKCICDLYSKLMRHIFFILFLYLLLFI